MSTSLLVTSAQSKQTLAVIRSLAKLGYRVSAVGSSRFSQSFYSEYCSESYVVPDSTEDPEGYISALQSIMRNGGYDVLLPVTAADTVAVARYQDRFHDTVIATDSFENIQLAHNKEKATNHAEKHNVPVPETYCPSTEEELQEIAETIDYPAVVKLRKTAAATGLRYVYSPEALLSTYSMDGSQGMAVDYSRPLIQEYVSGDIHDVCVLFEDGELQNALTQKRVRMFPASGGAGVVNVTTDRPDLVQYVDNLLSPLDWDGVAQVEFMDSEELRDPKLIEINPKIWGTIELSIAAGMNFPQKLVDMKLGRTLDTPITEYTQDLYFIWYEGGLLGNIYESDGLITPFREILNIRRRNHTNNISLMDPLPHTVRAPQLGSMAVSELLERWT